MYIKLITIGKIKEKYWKQAIDEYEKRLKKFHRLQILELEAEKDPNHIQDKEKLLDKEAQRILQNISETDYIIALAIEGNTYNSLTFSKHMMHLDSQGNNHIAFIIGGSHGLSKTILNKAHETLSFSSFTFPHQLMRVIFLEQLYRASTIEHGTPYHK